MELTLNNSANVPAQRGSIYEVFVNNRRVSEYVGLEEVKRERERKKKSFFFYLYFFFLKKKKKVDEDFINARFEAPEQNGALLKCNYGFNYYIQCQGRSKGNVSSALDYLAVLTSNIEKGKKSFSFCFKKELLFK